MSPTPDSTLTDPEQTIADLRHQLALRTAERDDAQRRLRERTAERDEALEQQTATAEVLQVINSSPGDLTPVFEALLDKALTLCGGTFGIIRTYDGDSFHLGAMRGVPSEIAELMKQPRRPPFTGMVALERIVAGEPVVEIGDPRDLAGYRAGAPTIQAMVDRGGARTGLWVALRKEAELLGFIWVYRQEIRPFTDRQIALLQNFASQAVIAIENARLITETREALEQQTATAEVLEVINSSPGDLGPVFDAMLDKALDLCGAAFGNLWTFDGERFRAAALRRVPEAYVDIEAVPPRPGTVLGQIAAGKAFAQIPDAASEDAYMSTDARTLVELGGGRTVVGVPLRKETSLLGAITIFRQEVKPFTEQQIEVLQNFAAQAVIAMENARLITETHEALERQTATAEVLQVINSSPGDLAPVFDAILEKALNLCGAAHGHVFRVEGDLGRAVAARGASEFVEWLLKQGPVGPTPGGILHRMMHGERVVQIPDSTDTEGYRAGKAIRELIDRSGVRTTLGVALRNDSGLLGAIFVNRREVRPFSDKEIALLENFAAQAVIAMENARLLAETREALDQQTATAEVLQVINSSPGDLTPVFDAILEKAHSLCGVEYGTLQLYDGEKFRILTRRGFPEKVGQSWRDPYSVEPNSPLRALLEGEPLAEIPDVIAYQAEAPNPRAEAAISVGVRSVLFLPLRRDNLLLGVISAGRKEAKPFREKEIALLQNFAAQAVIAMENARLLTETREALEQQTATAEVLQVINSSPGDLAPVFEEILDKAHALCGAAYGGLLTYDGDAFQVAAARGDARFVEYWRQAPIRPPEGTPLWRVMRGEGLVQIIDAPAEDSYHTAPPYARLIDLGGVRTFLSLPLRKDDALLGVITAYRREVRPFSDKQIALLQNFGAQAVIAMENARLLTETREALEQQTATAGVLQVINSSPGDLAPVFDAMLDKATRLCEADFGILLTYAEDHYRAAAFHNVPSAYVSALQEPIRPNAKMALGRIARGDPVAQIEDIAADEELFADPTVRGALELAGFRTVLAVALRKDGALLGAITIYRQEARLFSDKQIALLQNFAAQAVIAMENARLLTETREALEQQTATAEVLQVINSSPGDLAPVFDAILEKAHTLCGAAHGSLTLARGEHFRAVATRGMPEEFAQILRQPFHPGSLGDRLSGREPFVQIADITAAEFAADFPTDNRIHRAAVGSGGVRTLLVVPLRKDGALLGYITANRREVRTFTDKQIALLQNFAQQAVIAMENARLMTETREALEQQTATAEVLQVINSSPGDLAPVFDAILERAHHFCDAPLGSFVLRAGERWPAVATRGYSTEHDEIARRDGLPNDAPAIQRLARGEVVHAPDLTPFTASNPVTRAAVESSGSRTYLAVPLRKDGILLGYLSAHRQEVRPFTDKQIALLQNFASQAVIAMENARLITETREALEQQTATAEVLQVINSSPGDLAPVFDAMLEKAMRLCEADFGTMFTVGAESARVVAARDLPAELSDFLAQHPLEIGPDTFFGRAVLGRSVLHTADMRGEAAYQSGQPLTLTAVDRAGVRALLMAPLLREDGVSGVFAIFRREARAFADKQIALLQNFAAQAVIAMENARLLIETREALEQQTATAEVLQVINSSPGDLAPVFDQILEKAHTLCGAAHGTLTVSEGEHFRAVAMQGIPEGFAEVLRQPFRPGVLAQRLIVGEPFVHIPDVTAVESWPNDPLRRAGIGPGGVRTLLAVPLRKDGALLGYITANRREVRPFTDKQIALLQNFAAQAVIAMENARLLDELHQRTDQVAELNRGLEARVAEQVDELGRVGRLKRFLAPQLAELIVSQGDEQILESHRREIVVVFCDLRGYTAFTETAEPEEVLDFLREYHGALGPLVAQFEGTLDQFSGDGIMVFFNDPVPCPDPAERAVAMAVAMREAAGALIAKWRRRGRELGFGAGIAQGYATLGQIGFAERSGYTAIGTVCNLAARLCAEAKDGQILVAQRVAIAVEETTALEEIGALTLKGLTQPVVAYNVPPAAIQPALRVIEGGPHSV